MKDYKIIQVKVAELDLAPWNYKENDETTARKLKGSMVQNGYVAKIAIAHKEEEPESNRYEVLDGNHRAMAFKEMEIEEVSAVYIGRVKLAIRKRIGIELNEIKFLSDNIRQAQIMVELVEQFGAHNLEETMPYSEQQIEDMKKILEFDWQSTAGESKGGNKSANEIGFRFGVYHGDIPRTTYDNFMQAVRMCKDRRVVETIAQVEQIFGRQAI